MCLRTRVTVPVLGLVTMLMTASLWAQEKGIRKQSWQKTQNPVADLISVPFQNNFNFGAGTEDKMIYVLNVQPVIPLKLSEDWNLIARIITPIINQPSLFPGTDSAFGLGGHQPPRSSCHQPSPASSSGEWGRRSRCPRRPTHSSAVASGAWGRRPWR